MARTLKNKIEKLSAARKNKINIRVKKLIAQEIKLRDLKESQGKTRIIDRSTPKDKWVNKKNQGAFLQVIKNTLEQ